jgi:hypothetical protein
MGVNSGFTEVFVLVRSALNKTQGSGKIMTYEPRTHLFSFYNQAAARASFPGMGKDGQCFRSRVAHKLNRKDETIAGRVIELRRTHPEWGKFRIADEMAKENNWVPIISPNTVRRILQEADLWPEQPKPGKKKGE